MRIVNSKITGTGGDDSEEKDQMGRKGGIIKSFFRSSVKKMLEKGYEEGR